MPRKLTYVALLLLVALVPVLWGCAAESAGSTWAGSIDTLATGQIVVRNPNAELWTDETRWSVVEDLRIGSLDSDGPDMFGAISDFETDAGGRLWVFEGQAQEIRVFAADGEFLRTVGRQGEGPNEFNRVIGMTWGPEGNLWTVDPSNNRLSVVDTTGAFVTSHPTIGGVMIMPWPGGFDGAGQFYTYGIDPEAEEFGLVMVRYDSGLQPIDSVAPPEYPGEREFFELRNDQSFMRTGVPFTPSLEWMLRDGHYWAALTGEYRIFELDWNGDTLRSISREYEPVPVTAADIDAAMEGFEWFISQGGKVDPSRIPSTKPAIDEFTVDDEGNLWVLREPESEAEEGHPFDVFDPEGRFLGQVRLPFPAKMYPPPIIRGGYFYAITEDDLEVPYVVRARIVKGTDAT